MMNDDFNENHPDDINIYTVIFSCFVALIVSSIFSLIIEEHVIKPRLYDGSVNELGRYSMTFDAYQHISMESSSAVIAIGSSKMREAFDGILIGEKFGDQHDFYNLAVAGDRPYVRMLEIEAIIKADPRLVIIEIGPNTLSHLSTPIPESIISRMSHLSSLGRVNFDKFPSTVLNISDFDLLPTDYFSQREYISSYTPEAVEDTLRIDFFGENQPWPCEGEKANVRCVPRSTDSSYDDYLRYPTQFTNTLERVKAGTTKWTIEEFYGERLDNYINASYHNPEGLKNKNQVAFEFIIDSLTQSGISVALVGLPYNPVLLDRLQFGAWDYYNYTISQYQNHSDIDVYDMLWDDDWEEIHFNDYTHMSREGEILFSKKIAKDLSESINIGNYFQYEPND